MGAVILLTPVVIAAWPAFASAVASAATSLGYSTAAEMLTRSTAKEETRATVQLEVPNSEVVTDSLGRDQKIVIQRGDITVTFRRDARGKASLTVIGDGQSEEELRGIGEEVSQRVVRQYVYQQIMNELQTRDYMLVEESTDANNSIHLTVRRWEN